MKYSNSKILSLLATSLLTTAILPSSASATATAPWLKMYKTDQINNGRELVWRRSNAYIFGDRDTTSDSTAPNFERTNYIIATDSNGRPESSVNYKLFLGDELRTYYVNEALNTRSGFLTVGFHHFLEPAPGGGGSPRQDLIAVHTSTNGELIYGMQYTLGSNPGSHHAFTDAFATTDKHYAVGVANGSSSSGWLLYSSLSPTTGEPILTKRYYISNSISLPVIAGLTGNSLAVAGFSLPMSTGGITLIKLNVDDGTVQFSRRYPIGLPGDPSGYVFDALTTPDGGYVLAGSYRISTKEAAFILKTSSNGDVLWAKHFPLPGNSDVTSIDSLTQTSDGSYAFTGKYLRGNFSGMWNAKVSSSGSLVWQRVYRVPTYFSAYDIASTAGSELAVLRGNIPFGSVRAPGMFKVDGSNGETTDHSCSIADEQSVEIQNFPVTQASINVTPHAETLSTKNLRIETVSAPAISVLEPCF